MIDCLGQNLVPNSSFELNSGCPGSMGNIKLVNGWWSPWGKPVYFHACNNYRTEYRRIVAPGQKTYNEKPVIAHSGEAYVGIYMSVINVPKYHDYLMCKLKTPLLKDSTYQVEMMVQLANVWKYVDYIGVHFTHEIYTPSSEQTFSYYSGHSDAFTYKTVRRVSLNFDKDTIRLSNSQYKLNDRHHWIKVSGEYHANGGEQYIIIGNFSLSNNGLFNNNVDPENAAYTEDGHCYIEGGFDYSSYQNSFYYIDDVYIGKQSIKESRSYQLFASEIKFGETLDLKNIYFETGKSNLKKESILNLNILRTYLIDHKGVNLTIEGHTDNIGNEEANLFLSQKRAEAIVNYLKDNGIESSRMKAIGFGCLRPIANNESAEGRKENRRVEFTLTQ